VSPPIVSTPNSADSVSPIVPRSRAWITAAGTYPEPTGSKPVVPVRRNPDGTAICEEGDRLGFEDGQGARAHDTTFDPRRRERQVVRGVVPGALHLQPEHTAPRIDPHGVDRAEAHTVRPDGKAEQCSSAIVRRQVSFVARATSPFVVVRRTSLRLRLIAIHVVSLTQQLSELLYPVPGAFTRRRTVRTAVFRLLQDGAPRRHELTVETDELSGSELVIWVIMIVVIAALALGLGGRR